MADLRVDIASQFTGAAAFKKADTAVGKLNKSVIRLGRNLGLALGTTAIIAFGKASVKAFATDEAAAKRLSTAVDNLGLSLSQSRVTSFIENLEASSKIADDVLRPAFQALLTTTGSLTKSQELLNNAIQISRASTFDLGTVSEDLAKGFVGVTRGLRKYNTGLTQAELKSKSFNEILGIMLLRSAGAAEEYLTTTSYKMDVLALAAGNAQETIGEGLVDALARVGGGTEASDAAKSIDNLANAASNLIVFLGTAIGLVEKFRKGYTNFLAGGDVDKLMAGTKRGKAQSKPDPNAAARIAQQRQAEIAAAKRAKELAALANKQVAKEKALTAERKKQAALKKAGSIFDLEQIQIIAALKGNLSKEDQLRLKAQLALLNGNEVVATALTKQILMAQDQTGNLYKLFLALPDARNPFAYLEGYLTMLAGKAASVLSAPAAVMAAQAASAVSQTSRIIVGGTIIDLPTTNVQTGAFPRSQPGDFRRAEEASNLTGAMQVVVQIDGKAIASSLQNSSLSGIGSTVNRTGG